MDLQQMKEMTKSYFSKATEIVEDVPDRTKGWRGDPGDQGIIPSRAGVDQEGRIIPSFSIWWAPWMLRVVLIIARFIIGGVSESINSSSYPDIAMLILSTIGFVMWFLRNQTSRIPGLTIAAVGIIAVSLMAKSVLVSPEVLVLFTLVVPAEYIYAHTAFDYNTATAFKKMRQALFMYGTAYELEERDDASVNGKTLTTISVFDSEHPTRVMI